MTRKKKNNEPDGSEIEGQEGSQGPPAQVAPPPANTSPPMHEDNDAPPPVDPEQQPVTIGQLKTVLEEMSKQFELRIQDQDRVNIERLNNFGVELQNSLKLFAEQVNARLNEGPGQGPPAQQQQSAPTTTTGQGPRTGGSNLTDKEQILQILQPHIDKAIGKYLGTDDDIPRVDPAVYEFRKNSENINRMIYKKAAIATGRIFDKVMRDMLKSGDLTDQEAASMVQASISTEPPAQVQESHQF